MKLLRLAPENTKFGFMRFRRVSYPLSAILSIISVLMFLFVGMNFGIDFAGGTQVEMRAKSGEAHIAELRAKAESARPRPGRGAAASAPTPTCCCASTCSPAATPASRRRSPSCARPSRNDYEFRSVDAVGPSVSAELVQSGTLGVVVAIIAVLTYLWFRFEWQFAVGAIIGTMHDLLLTVGFFCVTQLEFNQTSIAAILTIVGYSLNETVVVLDRIREVMRKYKRLSTAEIVDMSVNAVLPRTIMTATTVFLALLALFFLGGHVIRSFSAAMIWGIFVATYSSIFICSPMLIYLGVRADVFDRTKEQEADRRERGREGQGLTPSRRRFRAGQPSDRRPTAAAPSPSPACRIDGSILATPRGVQAARRGERSDVDVAESLAPLFDEIAEAPGSIEFSSSARAQRWRSSRSALSAALREAGLRFEAMATGPALRVYNVMRSEGRRVAAALIAAP